MNQNLKSPLTAVVVIFICSCVAAVLAFRFLQSTATFKDSTGLQMGGAIVGLLITFIALWRSFHTFSSELGKTDRERMEEQIKNLQNQLVRQNPPPAGYRRMLSEDFQMVAHVPTAWNRGNAMISFFAPSAGTSAGFADNIVIVRQSAKWAYRELKTREEIQALLQAYEPAKDKKLQTQLRALQGSAPGGAEAVTAADAQANELVAAARSVALGPKIAALQADYQLHRDDPLKPGENVGDTFDLLLRNLGNQILGIAERTVVGGHPAIKFQMRNPISDTAGVEVVNIVTQVFVAAAEESYIYDVTLTAASASVGIHTDVYNRVVNSISFLT